MPDESIYQLLRETVRADPGGVAYQYRKDDRWVEVTWSEAARTVRRISGALSALGAEHGDKIGVLAQTRLEWLLCDLGIAGCGCVTVGIYPSNLADECRHILDHSETVVLVVENRDQLEKILPVRGQLSRLRKIVVFDGPGDEENDVLSWEAFLALGDETSDQEVARRGEAVRPDDLAALVYTSGTTGKPKGVMITNHNMIFTTRSAAGCIPIEHGFAMLLFLPLAHVFARLMVYCCLIQKASVAFAESLATVARDIKEVRPHFIPSAPRGYEKFYEAIMRKTDASGERKRRVFHWAVGVGGQVRERRFEGRSVPLGLRLRHALADTLVLRKIRAAFGGRLVFGISGSAPLNPDIGRFFDACGVVILEGIGMTENTSFSNVNRIERNKFGTVGPIGPGLEMKIAEDGEVLFRGGHVMKGYFKDPEATAEAIDADGWLHSGDIGEIDEEGYLRITDRKKEMIVTSGGKNVAPARIEVLLRGSPYISHAVAYGDKRKYLTALISLELDNIKRWAAERGLDSLDREELSRQAEVHELIAAEVERVNTRLASFETIKKFFIVPRDFTVESGDLTPSLKLRRNHVIDEYRDELAALY